MLLHADNFSYFGGLTAYMDDGVYAEIQGPSSLQNDPDGISTGKVFMWDWNNQYMYRWVLPAAHATVGIAARYWLDHIPADANSAPNILQWADGANVLIAYVRVTPTGALSFYNNGVLVATTTGPVITADGWWHIEGKLVCDLAAGGEFELRVEGATVLTAAGLTTTSATCAQVRGSSGHGAATFTRTYIKDLVVWDGSGTENNDFLGSVIVYELTTTADVALNWDSTAANGYSVLDNNPPQDGVAYISAPYPAMPAASEFSLSDLPADVTSVVGLVTRVRAAKSDGGDGQFQVSLKSAGSTDAGADRPITVAQTYWSDVSELDPATAAPWTPLAVNAATLKLDRTL